MSTVRSFWPGSLTLVAALVVAMPVFSQPTPTATVQLDAATGKVSLRARNAPLKLVLEKFAAAGIEIVVPEVEVPPITLNVSSQPVDVVVARFLPAGTRYWLRGDKTEVVVPGRSGDKKGRREPRPTTAPAKGSGANLPPLNSAGGRKPSPEERFEPGKITDASKSPPTVREVPDKPGPKIARKSSERGRYVRLQFTMTSSSVTLVDARVLPGELVADRALLGDYVWALEVPGRVLATGSFRDPLELHSYQRDPTREHSILTAKSGDFLVSLPESALDPQLLGAATLTIYRLTGTPPANELTPETFPKFRPVLKPIHTVPGTTIARQLQ